MSGWISYDSESRCQEWQPERAFAGALTARGFRRDRSDAARLCRGLRLEGEVTRDAW